MDTKPYYALMLIILLFIFLWYFFGGQSVEFVGLKPLDPDYIMDYQDASYKGQLSYPTRPTNIKAIDNHVHYTDPRVEELPSIYEDDSGICVDLTPTLPFEFTNNLCFNTTNTSNSNKYLSKGEKICRDTLEKIYGMPFPNVRPGWLVNDKTGRCLELDCYNEDLKLAVEMDGIFHYKWPNSFHKTYEEFKEQQYRDRLKDKLCKERGVHLIRVPYNVQNNIISVYIISKLPEIVQRRINEDV